MRNIMKNKNEQGTALIATLIFLVAMGILSTTLVFTVNNEMKTSASYKYSQQAFYIADAGIQEAVRWFSDPAYDASAYLGQYNLTTLPPSFGSGSTAPKVTIGQSGGNGPSGLLTAFQTAFNTSQNTLPVGNYSGVYVVSAKLLRHTPAHFISATMNSETPNGTGGYNSSVERWQVESIGYWGTSANPLGVSKITAIIQNDGDAFFDRALWGIDSVNLTGTSLIDSYDSAFAYGGTNVGNLGDIGTNGDITGGGSAQVDGFVYCQAGFDCDLPSNIDGSTVVDQPRTFNPIDPFTTGTTNLELTSKVSTGTFSVSDGQYGTVSVCGSCTLTIPAGTWYMENLDVQGTLRITGDATLYVAMSSSGKKNGYMDVSAQAIVNDGVPRNLTVFYNGTNECKWTGGVGISASLYAPNAKLTLRGNAEFFGSFVAKDIDNAGSCAVHFDQASLRRNLIRRPFRIITWSRNSL